MTRVAVEDATGGRVECEVLRHAEGQTNPAGRQHTAEVPVGKGRYAAGQRRPAGEQTVGSRRDLHRRFAARTAVGVDLPVRAARADFVRALAVIVAVVPFGEVGLDHGPGVARQFGSAAGSLARAGEG